MRPFVLLMTFGLGIRGAGAGAATAVTGST
jgi:hypothetical protein